MRAAEDERVDAFVDEAVEVLVRDRQQLRAGGDAGLDELHEPRARGARDLDLRRGGEAVGVGTTLVRRLRRDDADAVVARRRGGAARRRADDLDDGHVVALTGVVEHGGRGGVARDDEQLDPVVDEPVETLQRELTRLRDRPGAVGRSRRVAEVGHRLVGQLVDDRPGHRQPAEARVEDADRLGAPAHSGAPPTRAWVSDSCSQVRKS